MKNLKRRFILVIICMYGMINHAEPLRIIDGKDAGLVLQKVPDVWAEGYYGQGVLIASIDEDFNWDHPDIVNQIWNNLGEDSNNNGVTIVWNGSRWVYDPGDLNNIDDDGNGYVDDLIGWNFVNDNNIVSINDANSHGTQVAGVLVGDGTNGLQTGIAPQAKLMLLRIGTNSEQEQYYAWDAMQYCIDMGVDIISQSQSFHWNDTWCDENGQNCGPPDVARFRELAELELEAGIIHFSSISNDGNTIGIPFNISVPGNLPPPWLHWEQTLIGGLSSIMGVGNVDAWHTPQIHNSSPYGPSSQEDYSWFWTDARPMPIEYQDYPYSDGSMGLLKPDISAYGAGTESINGTYPNFIYDAFGGTSSASPHAAGVAALLLSVDPGLTPSDICRIMELTSIDNGPAGHDNRYGAGTVDAYAAYLQVISKLPVELSSFSANIKDNKVIIEWRTETELNNFGFDIERTFLPSHSIKDRTEADWKKIDFVRGNGNSNQPIGYEFTDSSIRSTGVYSYRLKQIDLNGSAEYSDEIEVNFLIPTITGLKQNYPNPFNPVTRIKYSISEAGLVRITVHNIIGEEVALLVNEHKTTGNFEVEINASNLPSGVYFYKLETEKIVDVKKFILLK